MMLLDFPLWMRIALGVLGIAIAFSCFCRARHMTRPTTLNAIRYATTALAGSAFALALAVTLRPDWIPFVLLALSGATLAVQAASAFYWRRGLPQAFTKQHELDLSVLREVSGGKKQ